MIKIQKDEYAKDSIFLHLDLLNSASNRQGVDEEFVTLHVGAGTFQPVKSDKIG